MIVEASRLPVDAIQPKLGRKPTFEHSHEFREVVVCPQTPEQVKMVGHEDHSDGVPLPIVTSSLENPQSMREYLRIRQIPAWLVSANSEEVGRVRRGYPTNA